MQKQSQNNLEILHSLEEILKKGYKINTSIPEEKRCKYCNKILQTRGILNPIDKSVNIFIQSEKCNCEKFIKEQKELEYKKEKILEKELEDFRKEDLNKRIKMYYGTDFITKQFKRQTLENLIVNENNKNIIKIIYRFINNFKNAKKGIIFVGKNGTGKTHMATAIANELIKQKVPVIFGTLGELVDKYGESYKTHTEIELTKIYSRVDLLIIDDLGLEAMNEWMLSKLFVIVNERMKNELPVIITTNYDLTELKQRLSIPNKVCETTNSIISRLYQMCYRVECKGNDYRMN